MPIYEFRCAECRAEFEALCSYSRTDEVVCPKCGSQAPERLISRFAVSRNLTPCGTPASEAPACARNAQSGGCGGCCSH